MCYLEQHAMVEYINQMHHIFFAYLSLALCIERFSGSNESSDTLFGLVKKIIRGTIA